MLCMSGICCWISFASCSDAPSKALTDVPSIPASNLLTLLLRFFDCERKSVPRSFKSLPNLSNEAESPACPSSCSRLPASTTSRRLFCFRLLAIPVSRVLTSPVSLTINPFFFADFACCSPISVSSTPNCLFSSFTSFVRLRNDLRSPSTSVSGWSFVIKGNGVWGSPYRSAVVSAGAGELFLGTGSHALASSPRSRTRFDRRTPPRPRPMEIRSGSAAMSDVAHALSDCGS